MDLYRGIRKRQRMLRRDINTVYESSRIRLDRMDTLREAHFPQEEDSARGLFAYSFKKQSPLCTRVHAIAHIYSIYIYIYIYMRAPLSPSAIRSLG